MIFLCDNVLYLRLYICPISFDIVIFCTFTDVTVVYSCIYMYFFVYSEGNKIIIIIIVGRRVG